MKETKDKTIIIKGLRILKTTPHLLFNFKQMFNIVPQNTKKTIQESKMIMNVKLKKSMFIYFLIAAFIQPATIILT